MSRLDVELLTFLGALVIIILSLVAGNNLLNNQDRISSITHGHEIYKKDLY